MLPLHQKMGLILRIQGLSFMHRPQHHNSRSLIHGSWVLSTTHMASPQQVRPSKHDRRKDLDGELMLEEANLFDSLGLAVVHRENVMFHVGIFASSYYNCMST